MTTKINTVSAVSVDVANASFGVKVVNKDVEEDKTTELKESVNLNELKVSNDIKNLAADVGLSYEDTDTPDEIIAAIEDELQAQIDDAENNPQALSTLMGYYGRLNMLDKQLDELYDDAEELFSAMDMLTGKNREEFGF